MNCSAEIINSIKDKMNHSVEKLLNDIELEKLINYKIEYEKQKEEIMSLKRDKQELIDEMDNFKKVSIFKSMVSQISQKDIEIKTLSSIIKNKDNIIKSLQNEKKKNKDLSLLCEKKELVSNEEQVQPNETSRLIEEETPTEEDQPSEIQTHQEEETSTEETQTLQEEETPTEENQPSEIQTHQEEETSTEETQTLQEEETSTEEFLVNEIQIHQEEEETPKEETPEPTEEETPISNEIEESSKEKIVKKLKGTEYYIIENKIFEKKNNMVGKQLGICIIEQKKKKYKFTNKK